MPGGFRVVGRLDKFERDFKRLDGPQRAAVVACIKDLELAEIPAARRFHCVNSTRPRIYSVDIFANKSYKMTFEINGSAIVLRRVARHGTIDDHP